MKKLFSLLFASALVVSTSAQINQIVVEEIANSGDGIMNYPAGHATYDVYAEMNSADDRVTAVFAEGTKDLSITTSTGTIWNDGFGATTGDAINPAFLVPFPQLAYDSFVTIGRQPISPSDGLTGGVTVASALPAGTPVDDAFGTVTFNGTMTLADGIWFVTPDVTAGQGQGANLRVLLMRITTDGTLDFDINVQALTGGQGGTAVEYLWDASDITTMDGSQVDFGALGASFNGNAVDGCTDNTACNFDAAATNDDGSCEFPGDACDDGDANTINDVLQGDCSCAGVAIVNGCTDNTACNFDATANTDDGSCEFPGDACDDGDANTINDVLQGDCSCAGTPVVTNGPESQLDTPAGSYDLCAVIKADWTGADDYRFVFTPQGGGTAVTYTQGGPNTSRLLFQISGLEVGTTYDVTVDAEYGGVFTIGTVSRAITIATPSVAVDPNDNCANAGALFLGSYINATPFACGADKWEWTLTPSGGLPIVYTRMSSNRFLRLSNVPGLTEGTTYDVTVRAGYPNGAFTAMSSVECVEIVGAAPGTIEGPAVEEFVAVDRVETVSAAIYPNPNNGTVLNVNLNNVENSKVTIDIVSMTGAIAQSVELNVANGSVNEVINLNGLSSGLYFVNIVADNTVMTERLVIEK